MKETPFEDDGWNPTEPTLPELMEDYRTWVHVFGIERCTERMAWILTEIVERASSTWRMNMSEEKFEGPRIHAELESKLVRMCNACQDAFKSDSRLFPSWDHQGLTVLQVWSGDSTKAMVTPGPGIDSHGIPKIVIQDPPIYITGGVVYEDGKATIVAIIFSITKNRLIGTEFFNIFGDDGLEIGVNTENFGKCEEIFRRSSISSGLIYIPMWIKVVAKMQELSDSIRYGEIRAFLAVRDFLFCHDLSDADIQFPPYVTPDRVRVWRNRLGIHGPFREKR
jgi:hypothetical protein